MTKASDNEFPSVLFGELGAAPTTPAAGKWRVYTKSTGLFIVDDAGAETGPFSAGGGSGSITASGYTQNTARLLGRTTASAGAIEEITVGAGLSLAAGSLTASATLPSAHGCRVKRASTNFSVGNNTLTAVEFDGEDYDTDTMHDNVTNPTRITIPTISGVTTGLWSIKASGYSDKDTGATDVLIRLGGSTTIGFVRCAPVGSSGIGGYVIAIDWVFSAADYIECQVRTTAGAGNAVFDAGASPLFEVAFLGKVS